MKFFVSQDIRTHQLLRLFLIFYLIIVAGFAVLGVALEHYTLGLDAQTIIQSLRGNPDLFVEPRATENILLELHIRLFLLLVTFLTVFAVLFRTPLKSSTQVFLVASGFLAVLLDSFAILAIRYFSADFVVLKIVAFTSQQTIMLATTLYCLIFLLSPIKKSESHT